MAHTLARLRFADPVTETVARLATGLDGLTPGRAGFAPAGRRVEISWSHRYSFNPDRPAEPGRTGTPTRHRGASRFCLAYLFAQRWVVGDLGEGQWTGTESGDRIAVEVSVEQCVEAVDDAAVADGEAEFDHLLRVEMSAQCSEEFIRDRCHAGTGLREAHDGCFGGAVHALGKRVVA